MRDTVLVCSVPQGFGSAALALHDIQRKVNRHLQIPISNRKEALRNALSEVKGTCQESGWDGYDALAVPEAAFFEADLMIELLPQRVLLPEIVPEPSGAIGFEWRKGADRVFIASVSGANTIVYAGVLGGKNKARGIEEFFESIPSRITDLLLSYFSPDWN